MRPQIEFVLQLFDNGVSPRQMMKSWGIPKYTAYPQYRRWRKEMKYNGRGSRLARGE